MQTVSVNTTAPDLMKWCNRENSNPTCGHWCGAEGRDSGGGVGSDGDQIGGRGGDSEPVFGV